MSAVSTDAINGSQLYGWTQDTSNVYSNVSLYNQIVNISGGGANKWVTGNPSTFIAPIATGVGSTAVGSGASSGGANALAVGR